MRNQDFVIGGVSTFRYYEIFRSLDLGGNPTDAANYLMIENLVDLGFLLRQSVSDCPTYAGCSARNDSRISLQARK